MVQDVTGKPDLPFPAEHASQQPHSSTPSRTGAAARVSHNVAPAPIDPNDLSQAVKHVSEELQKADPQLQMEVDSDLGRVIVKILDGQSGQVIRQIPAQEIVNLAKQLKGLNGLLVEKHA